MLFPDILVESPPVPVVPPFYDLRYFFFNVFHSGSASNSSSMNGLFLNSSLSFLVGSYPNHSTVSGHIAFPITLVFFAFLGFGFAFFFAIPYWFFASITKPLSLYLETTLSTQELTGAVWECAFFRLAI